MGADLNVASFDNIPILKRELGSMTAPLGENVILADTAFWSLVHVLSFDVCILTKVAGIEKWLPVFGAFRKLVQAPPSFFVEVFNVQGACTVVTALVLAFANCSKNHCFLR